MYKKLIPFSGIFLFAALTIGCSSQAKQQKEETTKERTHLVGNDRDNHGCIASAGYQWSELLNDCIRPFEKGIKLEATSEEFSGSASYLVFNADSSKVEVYLPKQKTHPILERQSTDKSQPVWQSNQTDEPSVTRKDGKWNLSIQGNVVFVEK